MTNRENATAAVNALIAKQGATNSVTPTNLGSDQLQSIVDNSLMSDETAGIQVSAKMVLAAVSSSATQSPAGLDQEMAINYGPAVGGPTDDVQIDASGLVTINTVGSYYFALYYQFGRSGGAGTSEVLFRSLIDIGGVSGEIQAGDTIPQFLQNANDAKIIQLFLPVDIPVAGTTLRQTLTRDPNGHNSGDLMGYIPSTTIAPPVADSPAASLFIFKYETK